MYELLLQSQIKILTRTMTTRERKVILELNEHDAMRLLVLIEATLNEGDKIWQSYWERLAQHVKQGLERSGSNKQDLTDFTELDKE